MNGYMGVPGTAGTLVTTATKLPVPKAPGAKVLNAQLGCKGSHWHTITIFCRLWVLTGELGGARLKRGEGGTLACRCV